MHSNSNAKTNHRVDTALLYCFTFFTVGALVNVKKPTASFDFLQAMPMLMKINVTMVQIINPIIMMLTFCPFNQRLHKNLHIWKYLSCYFLK